MIIDVEKMNALIAKTNDVIQKLYLAKTALQADDTAAFEADFNEAMRELDTLINMKAELSL